MRTSRLGTGALLLSAISTAAQVFHPQIPKAWDDKEVASFEVPLADPTRSPRYPSAAEYYALEVLPIYRGYPIYAPDKEPAGYFESLKQKEPEIIFDPAKLRSEEDWIRAGALVFDAPVNFGSRETANIIKAEFIRDAGMHTTRDGVIPYIQWVVRKKGVVELGFQSCGFCHTRVLPDGTVVKGAQGDFPNEQVRAWGGRRGPDSPEQDSQIRRAQSFLYAAPWVTNPEELYSKTQSEMIHRSSAMQPGVFGRQGTSSAHPVHIPSLIGVKDLKYLDATGLTRHRTISDLMRYAIVNQGESQGMQGLARFGDFETGKLRPAARMPQRYSDEQLYALALFLYSLRPPNNPNALDDRARRGQSVFKQQGCAGCHPPPLYTNNKLTPAPGFRITEERRGIADILDISVGTDAALATRTRRGTGFYKVPSLRGVWFRNAFGHSGQAETLEEWFDAARFGPDYVPKGFHLGPGRITGHEFGTRLPADDRNALIAFLKTL